MINNSMLNEKTLNKTTSIQMHPKDFDCLPEGQRDEGKSLQDVPRCCGFYCDEAWVFGADMVNVGRGLNNHVICVQCQLCNVIKVSRNAEREVWINPQWGRGHDLRDHVIKWRGQNHLIWQQTHPITSITRETPATNIYMVLLWLAGPNFMFYFRMVVVSDSSRVITKLI